MPVFKRLKYAMCVLIAITMILMLSVSIAGAFGVSSEVKIDELMFHPIYFLPVFGIGYALAPALFERLPISGDLPPHGPSSKPPFGYSIRVTALAFLALILAMLANLLVYLFEKVT
jgi:hypothetical protein